MDSLERASFDAELFFKGSFDHFLRDFVEACKVYYLLLLIFDEIWELKYWLSSLFIWIISDCQLLLFINLSILKSDPLIIILLKWGEFSHLWKFSKGNCLLFYWKEELTFLCENIEEMECFGWGGFGASSEEIRFKFGQMKIRYCWKIFLYRNVGNR